MAASRACDFSGDHDKKEPPRTQPAQRKRFLCGLGDLRGKTTVRLADLNVLDDGAAFAMLFRCCGSSRWAGQMAKARPFVSADAMDTAADTIWRSLDRVDWLEAFAAHPKIGAGPVDRVLPEPRRAADWSSAEQAGMADAAEQTKQRLAEGNRDYEARFGYIFIVCATGKTADEMLSLLEARLRHDADRELLIAAEEQRKITRLRLRKLLEEERDTTL
jgi:OHCU decarboxylase